MASIPGMGVKFGEMCVAEIIAYDSGNVRFRINGDNLSNTSNDVTKRSSEFTCPMPLSWAGPNGEFIGGVPALHSECLVQQAKGGNWYIVSYLHTKNIFKRNNTLQSLVSNGRAVMAVQGGNYLYVDPTDGVISGNVKTNTSVDPKLGIISDKSTSSFIFNENKMEISGPIKRDLSENTSRNLISSTYDSNKYDLGLWTIGLDPTAKTSFSSIGDTIRNPPLTESREIIYEFSNSFGFLTDQEESEKITEESLLKRKDLGRRSNRTDALSLGLNYPNQLIETIKGTAVDIFGNILDINRSSLPIGKIDELSLTKTDKKDEAFAKIRAQLRKSLAYHLEINTRKEAASIESPTSVPDTDSSADYARNRSRFFVDIDKEGQFKINIPASSETGNIPLPTRYENYSVLLSKTDETLDPNLFARSSQDIYHDGFSSGASIKIKSNSSHMDGYAAPNDRIKNELLKFGTTYHDITSVCDMFTKAHVGDIVTYAEHNLNKVDKYEKIVSDSIVVDGSDANAGGRSGSINLDGFIAVSVGANTVDRQSAWFDYAGSVVSAIGRDKSGISYAAHLDGDMIVQVGGRKGLSKDLDSRFVEEDDGYKSGVVDIRVITKTGLVTVFRMDELGVSIATQGRMDFHSAQDMVFTSDADIHLNGKNVRYYGDTGYGKSVLRRPGTI